MSDTVIGLIWLGANLVTFAAYMHIPTEMIRWGIAIPHKGLHGVLGLFLGFIVACGLHHLNMAGMWAMHTNARLLLTDVPMAALSVITSYALVHLRPLIIATLRKAVE